MTYKATLLFGGEKNTFSKPVQIEADSYKEAAQRYATLTGLGDEADWDFIDYFMDLWQEPPNECAIYQHNRDSRLNLKIEKAKT